MSKTFTNQNWGSVLCTLDENGTLIINTEGKNVVIEVTNNEYGNVITPWDNYRSDVKSVIIKGHISFKKGTSLNALFDNCYNCESFKGLENLDVSEVIDMSFIFYNCSNLTSLDLSNWNVAQIKIVTDMLYACAGLTYIITPKKFDKNNLFVTEFYGYYRSWYDINDNQLTSKDNVETVMIYRKDTSIDINLNKWYDKVEDSCYWKLSGTTLIIYSMKGHNVGYNASDLRDQLSDVSNITDVFIKGSTITFKNTDGSTNPADLSWLFQGFNNCESFDGLETFNTTNVNNMCGMFDMGDPAHIPYTYNEKLKALNVSNFDTSNVIYMNFMFSGCSGLTSLNISNWKTSKVESMYSMFWGCSGLTELNVSNFDTTNVISMSYMFWGCSSLTELNVSNFDTSNIFEINSMFSGCSGLKTLDLSNFDTSNVEYMNSMFGGCSSLTSLDLSNFDTSNVTDMHEMFSGCSGLKTLDLGRFILKNITSESNIEYMLYGLTNLETIITPYQFDSNDLFQNMFITNLVLLKQGSEDLKNNELRDIGDLKLVTKTSNIRPSYVYTRKDSEVTKRTYELNDKISNILN